MQTNTSPTTQKSRLWRLFFFLVCLCIFTVAALALLLKINTIQLHKTQAVDQVFVVEPGSSLASVLTALEQQQLIQCSRCLGVQTRVFGVAGSIKAGTYQLSGHLSPMQIIDLLIAGQVAAFSVTLIEGKTLDEWLVTLQAHPQIKTTIVGPDRATRYQLVAQALGLEQSHPEGLFLPETYAFSAGTTDIALLKRALILQQEYLAEQWQQRQQPLPLATPYEALILASIIEKETGAAFERPLIAGVFIHRLHQKMRLETDPTVIYGIDDYQGNITRAHLREKTPYNTYQIHGLPPTPIAAPSRAAIAAALKPEQTEALFFVAKGDGTHVFSQTLAQHRAAIKAYQLRRRKDYRSSPAQNASK